MRTVVAYECQAGVCCWPIPFPYAREEDVGASLIEPSGLEAGLTQGLDYVIRDGSVFFLGRPGYTLRLYLRGDAAKALAANSDRVLAAQSARAASPAAVQPAAAAPAAVQAASQAAVQPAVQIADSRVDALAARLQTLEDAQARTQAGASAVASLADAEAAKLAEAGEQACRRLDQKLDVAVDAITLASEEECETLKRESASALAASAFAQEAAQSARTAGAEAEASAASLSGRVAALEQRLAAQAETAETRLAAQAETAAARLTAQGEAAESRASQAALSAAQSIEAALARAVTEAAAASRMAGQAWPETGWLRQDGDIAARSIIALPEPLRYWPGRSRLAVSRNGFVLIPGLDFEEVGTGNALANSIRILSPANTGDIWGFLVLPTNIAQDARDAASRAEAAAQNAATANAEASRQLAAVTAAADKSLTANANHLAALDEASARHQANLRAARQTALTEINDKAAAVRADCVSVWQTANKELRKLWQDGDSALRATWQKAEKAIAVVRQEAQAAAETAARASATAAARSGSSAADAARLADCAWQAAFQASIDRAQPGIASVTSLAELEQAVSGIYIINPRVNSRSPFMGVYPVADLSEATCDGVFFIGPPYPDQPALPEIPAPAPAPAPEPAPSAQAQSQWLPCGHTHI